MKTWIRLTQVLVEIRTKRPLNMSRKVYFNANPLGHSAQIQSSLMKCVIILQIFNDNILVYLFLKLAAGNT
jgi:hypothetical protein